MKTKSSPSKGLWYVTLEQTILQVIFEFQKSKDGNAVRSKTTVWLKSAPQKTKKTVFPETAEKSTGPLKTLTKLFALWYTANNQGQLNKQNLILSFGLALT